jgi:hypothetical protein
MNTKDNEVSGKISIQDLQYKNADTIDQSDKKNSFGGFIPVRIDVNGK